MPEKSVTLALALCLTILSSTSFAAALMVEPTVMWSGKVGDESLRKLAPKSGFIANADVIGKSPAAFDFGFGYQRQGHVAALGQQGNISPGGIF